MVLDMKEALGQWYSVVMPILQKPIGSNISDVLQRDEKNLQPKLSKIFRALQLTPPDKVKVVILGQDPYPGGHADGLAFSSGINDVPESLKQIFLNMEQNGFKRRIRQSLADWAAQGVLLLNTSLTTTKGCVNAHSSIGWQEVTNAILDYCHIRAMGNWNIDPQPMVFIAWGTYARNALRYRQIFDHSKLVRVLEGNHPAAVRHGYIFRGGEHFKSANEFLVEHGIKPIQWNDNIE